MASHEAASADEAEHDEASDCELPPLPPQEQHMRMVRGVCVKLPYAPYPPQLALLNNLLAALSGAQHALLEAPTGTGKTLALLGGVLAWREHFVQQQQQQQQQQDEDEDEPGIDHDPKDENAGSGLPRCAGTGADACTKGLQTGTTSDQQPVVPVPPILPPQSPKPLSVLGAELSGDDDFQDTRPFIRKALESRAQHTSEQSDGDSSTHGAEKGSGGEFASKTTSRVPLIIYATRTHSQVTQVVHELRKLSTYSPRLAVLASRSRACINERVRRQRNVDESCVDAVLAPPSKKSHCYFSAPKRVKRLALDPLFEPPLGRFAKWDLEDMASVAREHRSCAYFAAFERVASGAAELVVLPYNYVLDPLTCAAARIDLAHAVLIVDEAHNVDEVCRDSASFCKSAVELMRIVQRLNSAFLDASRILDDEARASAAMAEATVAAATASRQLQEDSEIESPLQRSVAAQIVTSISRMVSFLKSMCAWLQRNAMAGKVNLTGNTHIRRLRGQELRRALDELGLSETVSKQVKADMRSLQKWLEEGVKQKHTTKQAVYKRVNNKRGCDIDAQASMDEELLLTLSKAVHSLRPVEKMIFAASLCTSSDDALDAYDMVLESRHEGAEHHVELKLWCFDAKLVFKQVADRVRCVILASGTLSPLVSLKSELGVAFPITAQLRHVIDTRTQLYSAVVGTTATAALGHSQGQSLVLNYQAAQDLLMQDRYGHALLQLVRYIPGGALVFFPSFHLMSRLVERWRDTAVLDEMERAKGGSVFIECSSATLERTRFDEEDEEEDVGDNSSARTSHGKRDAVLEYRRLTGREGDADVGKRVASHRVPPPPSAMLFAVYRGRSSEGIDFRDNQARAVIALGIPYAPFRDMQVQFKREFNDRVRQRASEHDNAFESNACSVTQLQSGAEWYEAQAFRALNQAVGRCIRHREDYGAVLFLDSRVASKTASLSTWIAGGHGGAGCSRSVSVRSACQALDVFFSAHRTHSDQDHALTSSALP